MPRAQTVAVLACGALTTTFALGMSASPAYAAGAYAVTSTADSGPGTLRQAMLDATTTAGASTITVSAAVAGGTLALAAPLPTVPAGNSVTLEAGGLTVDGGGSTGGGVRAFTVDYGGQLTLSHITVANARALQDGGAPEGTPDGDDGAAVSAGGTLVVRSSRFVGNQALGKGGAIAVAAKPVGTTPGAMLTVSDTVFDANTASVGGAVSAAFTNLSITGTTFARNAADARSGALFGVGGPPMTVTNSTFVANRVGSGADPGVGSAIGGRAPFALNHVTLSGNGPAAALAMTYELFRATNSIMDASGCDFGGDRIVDGGYNLDPGTSCGLAAPTSRSDTNPLLDPAGLRDNGGPTPTLALQPGSPAVDHGSASGTMTDQRGLPRPVDNGSVPNTADGSDIGAVEDQRVGYQVSPFLAPIPKSSNVAGSTIPVKFRIVDTMGTPIPDAQAQALAAGCQVRVTLSGVTLPSSCATYTASTDTFQLDVKVPKTLTPGVYTITAQVVVGGAVAATASTPVTIRR